MMALVKVAFTDKTNMVDVYYPGDQFEGSEERVNELINSGHVVAVEDGNGEGEDAETEEGEDAETETAEEKPKPTRRRKAATKEG